jgi:Domain of unknown function (DUF222)
MFEQVRQAIERLQCALRELDPSRVDGAQARRLVEDFAGIERLAAAGKAIAVRRVEEARAWAKDGGHRDVASWLAATTGTTVGQARATVETAARLEELPETEAALRAGELSALQANEVTAAAAVDPAAEQALLESARRDGVKGLKDNCARVKAAACVDEDARYEAVRQRRSVRSWQDPDGTGRIDVRGPVDATARVMIALEPYEKDFFKAVRDSGLRERPEALAFDALVALADEATSGGEGQKSRRDPTVVVRVDHSAFVRGHIEPGEVCEIAGVGPIPVSAARRLSNDAFLKALITDGEDVRAVSHLGRNIPARLRTAVEELYPECVIEGCHVNRHLQIDHNIPVEAQGPTALWNLNNLCAWHHHEETRLNLRLEGEGTRKRLVPGPSPPPAGRAPPARELALV